MNAGSDAYEVLIDKHFQDDTGWSAMIKALRQASDFGLDQAIEFAFRHEGWRRWCNHRINHDRDCRKQALNHIKTHGERSLIGRNGEVLHIFE